MRIAPWTFLGGANHVRIEQIPGKNAEISRVVKLALASALLGAATAANAQDSAPTQDGQDGDVIDEVLVTGFRASLNAALVDKREATGALDSIHAEDIAKFPDSNLAESLQRIPGMAITRDAGEGRNLSVRGLGPQFTRVRINGMEAMSTTGGTDSSGGTNRNRQFDFNVFASELFNNLTCARLVGRRGRRFARRHGRPVHRAAVRLQRFHPGDGHQAATTT